ncbi:hypothetical protein L1887_34262 [Cichorium endivia]|nr:hypothetical protein L1887_34262 [Cichorium endivia]
MQSVLLSFSPRTRAPPSLHLCTTIGAEQIQAGARDQEHQGFIDDGQLAQRKVESSKQQSQGDPQLRHVEF